MKRLQRRLLAGACALGLLTPSLTQAITLSFLPGAGTVALGGSTTVDVVISGLTAGGSPSLGGYLLEIAYDSSLITPTAVVFGSGLDLGIHGSLSSWTIVSPGLLQLDEVSLEDPADLNASQPASFTLATLTFQGLAIGMSTLSFSYVDLVSEDPCCGLGATLTDGSLTVTGSTSVPDTGASWLLLALALGGLQALEAGRRCLRP